mgnify:CR=1 FL=1
MSIYLLPGSKSGDRTRVIFRNWDNFQSLECKVRNVEERRIVARMGLVLRDIFCQPVAYTSFVDKACEIV